ncbi:acyl-CoA desaturase [Amycolatopsis antarctica]|uniref:Acyl-CoA desaturase n=1 Tax=Amycolatopsis antarctica TaxID=1854586 RepID=A0A263D067_9PSEU|nr:acyl-CoA desaturase [Amycolatopsis antarctica]OZM71830.1 acyl-CoA desaturase [Amycolatopsis antarctica]
MTMSVPQLSPDRMDEFGRELDAIRTRIVADLGTADADYIREVVVAQRRLELAGRALLFAGWFPPAWITGVAALSLSKILDNMEIGHNVLHGQYDWMRDPALNSQTFEWDMVCPSDQWRRSHNFTHHTFTNILDKDRDIGYGILRITDEQKWHPYYLGNPLYAAAQAVFFQWGIMFHDLEADLIVKGERSWTESLPLIGPMLRKSARQVGKDYLVFPLLTGPLAPVTFGANVTANLVRNLWAFSIIFCGHFPAGAETFTVEETDQETRGEWYFRQILGSANITGSPFFHLMSGNLSHQIEHHLFPDLPSRRYPGIAGEVREICRRYGLPYNTGSLSRQLGSVARKIVTLALPSGGDAAAASARQPSGAAADPA